eukprot:188722_1
MIKTISIFTASFTGVGMKSLPHWLSPASANIAAREFNLAGDDNKSIGRDGDELNVFNGDGLIKILVAWNGCNCNRTMTLCTQACSSIHLLFLDVTVRSQQDSVYSDMLYNVQRLFSK